MPAPVVTLDKTTYNPGETGTATVVYTPRSCTITGTDQDGLTGTASFVIGGITLVANPTKVITKVSETGTTTRTATFTFVA
jgi:hypothetical protein